MKNQIYIQARMGSTRLPKKVLMNIGGKSIIELIVKRLRKVKNIDKIVLATSNKKQDNELEKEAKQLGIECFRGSQENIMDRFYQAGLKFKPDNIIRVSADCPLIDPELINKGLEIFKKEDYDILSNNRIRTYPDGLDFEIFKKQALKTAWNDTFQEFGMNKERFNKEFINPSIYILEKKKFKNGVLKNDVNLSHIRLTLDYQEDFKLIEAIYMHFNLKNKDFGLIEILEFLKDNINLLNLNKDFIRLDYGIKIQE